jgi:hypothetical protein
MFEPTPLVGVFALAVRTDNRPGAQYGSAPQGASANSYAAGVKLALR